VEYNEFPISVALALREKVLQHDEYTHGNFLTLDNIIKELQTVVCNPDSINLSLDFLQSVAREKKEAKKSSNAVNVTGKRTWDRTFFTQKPKKREIEESVKKIHSPIVFAASDERRYSHGRSSTHITHFPQSKKRRITPPAASTIKFTPNNTTSSAVGNKLVHPPSPQKPPAVRVRSRSPAPHPSFKPNVRASSHIVPKKKMIFKPNATTEKGGTKESIPFKPNVAVTKKKNMMFKLNAPDTKKEPKENIQSNPNVDSVKQETKRTIVLKPDSKEETKKTIVFKPNAAEKPKKNMTFKPNLSAMKKKPKGNTLFKPNATKGGAKKPIMFKPNIAMKKKPKKNMMFKPNLSAMKKKQNLN